MIKGVLKLVVKYTLSFILFIRSTSRFANDCWLYFDYTMQLLEKCFCFFSALYYVMDRILTITYHIFPPLYFNQKIFLHCFRCCIMMLTVFGYYIILYQLLFSIVVVLLYQQENFSVFVCSMLLIFFQIYQLENCIYFSLSLTVF